MANRINLGQVIGATGQAGQDGAKGDKGDAGDTPYISNGYWWIGTTNTGVVAKGNEWFSGDDVPTSQGVNGDLYLRTNGDVYKKENGVWVLKTNIKGQQGEQGERGESALTFDVGSVTTGDVPSVTNSGTQQDVVLDFVLPKGEKGDKGDKGDSTISVGGFVVSDVSFRSDPQGQIDGKMDNNFGTGNAGRFLQVDENGQVVAVKSSAENDVIDGYYYNYSFYEDAEHTISITGATGKIYIDVVTNTQYRWNGTAFVPLSADLSGYPTKAQAVGSIELTMDSSTYVLTLQAKNVNGENVGTAQTVDLPLESVVVNGSYNNQTKKVVLTLQNGSTIEFSVADLVNGLQAEITSANKLSADLVDDTNSTNKFVTASDKTNWDAKVDASDLASYLPLAGGTMTGDLILTSHGVKWDGVSSASSVTGGDGSNVRIRLTNKSGNYYDEYTFTNSFIAPNPRSNTSGATTSNKDLGYYLYDYTMWQDLYLKGKLYDGHPSKSGTTSVSIAEIESKTNKVTSLSNASTDTQYPSAKLLYNQLLAKQNAITSNSKLNADLVDDTSTTHKFVSETDIANWNSKQNILTFDDTPKVGSNNPVTSVGIYYALYDKATMALPTSRSFRLTVGSRTVIIQTGKVSSSSSNGWHTVTLPEPMPNATYILAGITGKNEGNNIAMNIRNKTTTTFQVYLWANATLDYIAIYTPNV